MGFKGVQNCSLNHFYEDASKSLSKNSNILVISVLATIDFLFHSILNFLVLGVMSNFLLERGHFAHDIMRLWILFNSSGFL